MNQIYYIVHRKSFKNKSVNDSIKLQTVHSRHDSFKEALICLVKNDYKHCIIVKMQLIFAEQDYKDGLIYVTYKILDLYNHPFTYFKKLVLLQ